MAESQTELERNCEAFWKTLSFAGVAHLEGQPSWIGAIEEVAQHTDMLDSDGICELAMNVGECSEVAVLQAAMHWLAEVKAFMREFPYSAKISEAAELRFVRLDELVATLDAALTSVPAEGSAQ